MAKVLSPEALKSFTIRTRYRTLPGNAKRSYRRESQKSTVIYAEARPGEFHYLVQRKSSPIYDRSAWALLKYN